MVISRNRRLREAYRFAGFRPVDDLHGVLGDPYARVVMLVRCSKNRSAAPAGGDNPAGTIEGSDDRLPMWR